MGRAVEFGAPVAVPDVECPGLSAGPPDAALTGRDMFLSAIDAGLGRWGAHIGSIGDQPDLFRADMLAFHASVLGT